MFYLKLTKAIVNAESDHGISKFDPISKEILKRVATADEMTRKLMMKDLSDLGSFPTVQTHLNKLIDLGWIERRDDATDKRAVLLVVAPRARLALQAISEGLHEWYDVIGRRVSSLIAHISAWTIFLEQAVSLCMT